VTGGTVAPQRWPVLGPADLEAVSRVLGRGVLSGAGAPEVRGLEAEVAALLGARFCLATNSGTAALHVALAAAGVGPGDEVIVPALSFIATAQAVLHQGGQPVFADVDPRTYTLDVRDAARRVTPRTRAIVPVHLHGLPADMDAVQLLAQSAGLTVVEDAAQAHGATYRGRPAGTLGAMAAFSLNSTKNLAAGEGGLFVTDAEELYARAARVRFDGLEPAAKWDPTHPLDDEAAALPVCPACGVADTWEARQGAGFRAHVAEIDGCASLAELAALGKRLYALALSHDQAGVAWSHYRLCKAALEAAVALGAPARALVAEVERAPAPALPRLGARLYRLQHRRAVAAVTAAEWGRIWQAYRARKAALAA